MDNRRSSDIWGKTTKWKGGPIETSEYTNWSQKRQRKLNGTELKKKTKNILSDSFHGGLVQRKAKSLLGKRAIRQHERILEVKNIIAH